MRINQGDRMRLTIRGITLPLVLTLGMAAICVAQSAPPPEAPAQESKPEPKPWLDIYGFAMMDMGFDFKQTHPDWFDVVRPTKLPSMKNEFGGDRSEER